MRKPRVLVVDGDEGMRTFLAEALAAEGCAVATARTADEALALLERDRVDLLISEIFLRGPSGIDLVKRAREAARDAPAILVARAAPIRTVVSGMQAGAVDVIEKPIDLDRLRLAVRNALARARLERENEALRRSPGTRAAAPEIVCASEAMRRALALCDRIAPTDLTVLIEGESGTGKELIASRIHRLSPRAALPIVAINCGAVPRTLIESELFGHEKGAFTGAVAERAGLIELADPGTLFLDEIGEMPLDLQAKLLRALETGEFRRVGGERVVRVDVRIVAATNRRLAEEVRKGAFREDLYYRLNVIAIEVPPLRRRLEEIPALVEAFVGRARRRGQTARRFTPDALDALRRHSWPGNVRELENLVERAIVLAPGPEVGAADLPELMRGARAAPGGGAEAGFDDADTPLGEVERRHILRALRKNGGNKVRTARKLGINVKTLYNKLKEYGAGPAAQGVEKMPEAGLHGGGGAGA